MTFNTFAQIFDSLPRLDGTPFTGREWWYLGRERKFLPYPTTEPDVRKAFELIRRGSEGGVKASDGSLMKVCTLFIRTVN